MINWVLTNTSDLPISLSLALLLLILWLLWDLPKFRSGMRLARAAAIFSVCLSFFLLYHRPIREKTKSLDAVLILGKNYPQSKLDSLIQAYPKALVLSEDTLHKLRAEWRKVDSWTSILPIKSNQSLPYFVLGHPGLNFPKRLLGANLIEIYPPEDWFIADLSYKTQVYVGQRADISLELAGSKKMEILVELYLSDQLLDTVTLNLSKENKLRFKPLMMQSGVNSLTLHVGDEQIPLIVQVDQSPKASILMLSDFPGFELRQLKQFLVENGHELIVQESLSKETFSNSFFNTDKKRVPNLSSEVLENLDILIITSQRWESLGNRQQKGIWDAVKLHGLGLFFMDIENFSPTFWKDLGLQPEWYSPAERTASAEAEMLLKNLSGKGNSHLEAQSILSEESDLYIQAIGKGQWAISSFASTFPMVLSGNKEKYDQYWTQTIAGVRKAVPASWSWEGKLVPSHSHQSFLVFSEDDPKNWQLLDPKGQAVANYSWEQSLLLPEWSLSANLESEGTFTLFDSLQNKSLYFPVISNVGTRFFPVSDWKSDMYLHQRQLYPSIPISEEEYFSLWYIFALMLISFGFLWLLEKM